jgi:hypothetical protein
MNGIRYNLGLPITPDVVENSQRSIETNLNYAKHLNLCYGLINTKERITQIQRDISNKKELSPTHLLRLHMLIESSLYTALSINFLTPPDNSYINPHYSSYQLRGGDKITPSQDYLDALSLGFIRTWGTEYGCLLYSVHMKEEYESYMTPSQLEDIAASYYLNSYHPSIDSLFKDLLILKYEDSESSDVDLYNLSTSLIYNIPALLIPYRELSFLSSLVPKLMCWYIEDERGEVTTESIGSRYLKEWVHTLFSHGVDESNSTDLAYLFLHQMIDRTWYDLYPLLLSLRSRAPEVDDSKEGLLIKEIKLGMHPSNSASLLTEASTLITRALCPPGGLNLFYLLISSALLNRAYILTDPSKEPLILSNDLLSNPSKEAKRNLQKRVYKLIYLAGYALKKCSLPHIRVLGGNLILLVGQQLPNRSISKDLLL